MNSNFDMEDLCRKFAQKVIEYIPLVRDSSTVVTTYPVYYIEANGTNTFLHHYLFQYFLFFSNIVKVRGIYIPESLSGEQFNELKGLSIEIEKKCEEPVYRELINSHIMGLYGNRSLMKVKQLFKQIVI